MPFRLRAVRAEAITRAAPNLSTSRVERDEPRAVVAKKRAYRRQAARATAEMPYCVAKQVSRPIRNREGPAPSRT